MSWKNFVRESSGFLFVCFGTVEVSSSALPQVFVTFTTRSNRILLTFFEVFR